MSEDRMPPPTSARPGALSLNIRERSILYAAHMAWGAVYPDGGGEQARSRNEAILGGQTGLARTTHSL